MKYTVLLVIFLTSLNSSAYSQEVDSVYVPQEVLDSIPSIPSDTIKTHSVFFVCGGDMPEYKGGMKVLRKYINKHKKYPQKLKKQKVQGRVYVSFIVAVDGSVKEVSVKRGVHPVLDEEAMRLVKLTSGNWEPGIIRGKAVDVKRTIPIEFRLKK